MRRLIIGLVAVLASVGQAGAATWNVTQLSNTGYNYFPEVSGSNVVWQSWIGDYSEIFLYDGTSTTQLTSSSHDGWNPKVSGSNVVWRGWDGSDWEIFLYNGTPIHQLTNTGYNYSPEVSGSNVVWRDVSGSDSEIFLYLELALSILSLLQTGHGDGVLAVGVGLQRGWAVGG